MRRRDLGLAFVWSMCFWVFFKGLIERTAVQYCFILLQCRVSVCVRACVRACVRVCFRVNHRYVCLSLASLVSGRTLSQGSWRAYGCVCKCIRKMNVFTANRCIFHLCVCEWCLCYLTLIGVFRKVGGASIDWGFPLPLASFHAILSDICIQWQHGTSYTPVLTWPWRVHVKRNTDPHKVISKPRQAPTLKLTSFVWTHSHSQPTIGVCHLCVKVGAQMGQ